MKSFIASVMTTVFIAVAALCAQPNPYVRLEAKGPAVMIAGTAANVQIFFHPKKGIHINFDPSPEVETAKHSIAAEVGTLRATKDAKDYLDARKPVVVPVTLSAGTPKGKQTLKLRVVYFLCSDADGWCNRDEQTVDLTVTVK